ncbi:hypothetical protein ABT299_20160 [Spirillospora sp. NPDC000708]
MSNELERLKTEVTYWKRKSRKHEKQAKKWRKHAEHMGYVAVIRELANGD